MLSKEQENLLEDFSNQSDILFDKGIIRTDSFTGEIGEYIVCKNFNLKRSEKVSKGIDAISQREEKYQIKAKVIKNDNINIFIKNLDLDLIDYLCIVYFNDLYDPVRIVRIYKDQIKSPSISISKKYLKKIKYEDILGNKIIIPHEDRIEITKFGKIFNDLIKNKIARSRKIVGDIGEYYARKELDLTLAEKSNNPGFDAVDKDGVKYEIKTRRVYESGRRKTESRRLNGIKNKEAKYLAVVVLDKSFRCAGIWKVPMNNIKNPKSAHLEIVNTTEGAQTIVESSVPWLQNRY